MKIGGYQIIDLENRNFTPDVGMVYDGIYELIESTRKPILLSGLQLNGNELHDTFMDFIPQGSFYVASISIGGNNFIVSISDVDVVTVSIDE